MAVTSIKITLGKGGKGSSVVARGAAARALFEAISGVKLPVKPEKESAHE